MMVAVSSIQAKLVRPLQVVLALLLTIYLALLSAQLIWFMVGQPASNAVALPEAKNMAQQKGRQQTKPVAKLHLFGTVGVVTQVKEDRPTDAPKTRLRLMLKGVFMGDQGGESGAIIEEIGKTTSYYRIGDLLPGNASLEEVYSDRVLLRRSGKLETLSFEEKALTGSTIARNIKPNNKAKNQRGRVDSPEQFIKEATQRLGDNPEKALQSVGLAPSADGGYVYQGNNPMLAGMNLEKGDVILSVNGHTLGDVQKDKMLMKSLYEQGSLEVEVVRGGASFFINYPLR